ncbi:MAG: hypothetical protein ABIJ61_04205 [bacterium]
MVERSKSARISFAAYAESNEQLRHVCLLAESIREFAGELSDAPVLIYVPEEFSDRDESLIERLLAAGAKVKECTIPEATAWFYYAGKTHAAGLAESELAGSTEIMVWLDEDTIVLQEPTELMLSPGIAFGYRPVMHNRSGTLYGEPPTPFWAQIYEVLEIEPDSLFPMMTPADRQQIRAYFNAGLLAVRPELGILRGWGESFRELCADSTLAQMCREDVEKRIFLHQTALVGAVFQRLQRQEMVELSERYNYPLFFKRQYGALEEFDDLGDVVTLRYDVYFRNPEPDWAEKLKGSPEKLSWLKSHLKSE